MADSHMLTTNLAQRDLKVMYKKRPIVPWFH